MPVAPTSTVVYWLPVVTAFAGYFSAQLSDWFKDRRTYQRERESRNVLRRDAVAERRNEFQRETLLALQEVMTEWSNGLIEMYVRKSFENKSSGEWKDADLPNGLTDRLSTSTTRSVMLSSRVSDANVRTLVGQFKAQWSGFLNATTRARSEESMNKASMTFQEINERIGDLLRCLDSIELES